MPYQACAKDDSLSQTRMRWNDKVVLESRPRRPFRAGFSLIEALVVLAIGGMALAIIFSIGTKAGDTGFGLGRRAMSASDADLANSDVRSIVRSIALRPPQTFTTEVDTAVAGFSDRLDTPVVMERSTQCAPQGWAGILTLSIALDGQRSVLMCQRDDVTTPPVELIVLDRGAMRLSYSRDGQSWQDSYDNRPIGGGAYNLAAERLFVRLTLEGRGDLIEMAFSGRPEVWVRPDGA